MLGHEGPGLGKLPSRSVEVAVHMKALDSCERLEAVTRLAWLGGLVSAGRERVQAARVSVGCLTMATELRVMPGTVTRERKRASARA